MVVLCDIELFHAENTMQVFQTEYERKQKQKIGLFNKLVMLFIYEDEI